MFPTGEGPFRAKGTIYQGLVASTDARCPGGFAAVVKELDDDKLRAFYGQHFLAASWYDLFPLIPFSHTAARVAGMAHLPYAREGARFQAVRDINGVHRFFLKLASPKMVAERLPRLMMQYFNFGRSEGRATGTRAYEVTGRGIPEPVAAWLITVIEGFVPAAMHLAGARSIAARHDSIEPDGEAHGVPLVRSCLHLTWT
jgi:hypothetical protein